MNETGTTTRRGYRPVSEWTKRSQRQSGPGNGNWKGGRSVASNGYVLVKAIGHPLADCCSYVYEHRLVAEQMIGRPLRPREQVHHRNGDKTDNRPENLEVCANAAHHRVRHRSGRRSLRLPGEPNPTVPCACGCGATLTRYDVSGRARRFVSGHNVGHDAAGRFCARSAA